MLDELKSLETILLHKVLSNPSFAASGALHARDYSAWIQPEMSRLAEHTDPSWTHCMALSQHLGFGFVQMRLSSHARDDRRILCL